MTKLSNIELVNEMIDKGYISVKKHPVYDLYIYNYTKQTSAEHVWNEATKQCRGIICDNLKNIVARPFTKFYNYEELSSNGVEIPKLPFSVYEKLDGSLGIMYFADNKPFIATRGSFVSSQAKHANNLLYSKYKNIIPKLDQTKTYLFEIIYNDPEVRGNLVVDYGNTDDIFLLAVIHTDTGNEDDISSYKNMFNTATEYDSVSDYLKFRDTQNGKNREGFVIKFSNNFRMKLKFEEYYKAHFLIQHLNPISICESIINGTVDILRKKIQTNLSEDSLLYFNNFVDLILKKHNDIKQQCEKEFRSDFPSRAETARYFSQCKYPSILFSMLDNKKTITNQLIWRQVKKSLANNKSIDEATGN